MSSKETSFKKNLLADANSGFMVFLIALPLCLGIAKASGFPPIAGIYSAVVGGLIVTFLTNSPLTIKGPAAGLIVIAIGAVEELGQGSASQGYQLTLAVIVISGILQVGMGFLKAGNLGDFFPSAVIHGMLAAIGIIIIAKQIHFTLGVVPTGKEVVDLFGEIPTSIRNLNPEVALIGLISMLILFLYPSIKNRFLKKLPAPLLVIGAAIPLGLYFQLDHLHDYAIGTLKFHIDPSQILVTLPNFFDGITHPDFSQIYSYTSIKYIIMFALVGSIESILSAKAVDTLDPEKRKSDLNRDLIAVGIGNTIAGAIGGLPMISEIVRSSANINNGAKSKYSNLFHGLFLLVFAILAAPLIQKIPNAALSAMLIYTGFKLASPLEFKKVKNIGYDQLMLFIITLIVTLLTDLLVGVAVGVLCKMILHMLQNVSLKELFTFSYEKKEEDNVIQFFVKGAATFTNFLMFKAAISKISQQKNVAIDFTEAKLIDHTFLENLHHLQSDFNVNGGKLSIMGFDQHHYQAFHPLASRRHICNPKRSLNPFNLSKRQNRLKDLSMSLGYEYEANMNLPLIRQLLYNFSIIPMVRYAKNLIIGNEQNYNLLHCEIHYDRVSDFAKERHTGSIVVISQLHNYDLTDFIIANKEDVFTTTNDAFNKVKSVDINFDILYDVYLPNDDKNQMFTNELQALLVKENVFTMKHLHGTILIHKKMVKLSIEDAQQMILFAKKFMEVLPKKIEG